eukprot:GHVO01015265.1.p1 GENE.GHVO01015265.1~~GHVO01015265.1.p1  ORF type:complete len:159 (-),score=13.67 GHVO01015265.1:352-828(-)
MGAIRSCSLSTDIAVFPWVLVDMCPQAMPLLSISYISMHEKCVLIDEEDIYTADVVPSACLEYIFGSVSNRVATLLWWIQAAGKTGNVNIPSVVREAKSRLDAIMHSMGKDMLPEPSTPPAELFTTMESFWFPEMRKCLGRFWPLRIRRNEVTNESSD